MNDIPSEKHSPWHTGELQVQMHAGVVERMDVVGRKFVRDFMPDQHREFYEQIPYLIVGAVDAEGWPWASMMDAHEGFISTPNARQLDIDWLPDATDPVSAAFKPGAALGLLGIDLHTRRRNRLNGHIDTVGGAGFSLAVEQSYGNCPQYIQLRPLERANEAAVTERPPVQHLDALDDAAIATIRGADTFFVASYVDQKGDGPGEQSHRSVDVSHRGGRGGFVRVEGDVLTIPDFAGNLFFNTLGNLLVNPRAGLVFIDFASGDMLHVAGLATVILDSPEIAAFQGAERLWQVKVEKVLRRPAALRSRWGFEGFSPNSLMTGDWEQTAARLQAEALRDQWRPLRVVRVEDESQGIRSFYFEAADGAGTSGFKAGQHLPLRVSLDGQAKSVIRTYSLSSAPSDDFFRISVKRDGRVSGHLHDTLKVGDLIEARTPQGGFFVDPLERRPLVLLGAGIGVTPMLSMLREVLYQNKRKRRTRPVWFVQSARRLVDLAFREEVDTLVASAGNELTVVRLLSQPESEARAGQDFHLAGRIDLTLLKTLLPFDDFDFYVCGPASFTQGLYDELRAMHIRDERIHAETFGPSTFKRIRDEQTGGVQQPPAATTSVPVVFERSAKEARWQPDGGTLLELAERRGLEPEYSCRSGSCGTCKTRLIKGQVHYPVAPVDMPAADHVLICCAVPAEGPLVLDL